MATRQPLGGAEVPAVETACVCQPARGEFVGLRTSVAHNITSFFTGPPVPVTTRGCTPLPQSRPNMDL
eukprot:9502382-Pyramimonas_sp.AAC.3